MSNATTIFLPWVRQGLAARIATPDPLTAPLPAGTTLGVALAVNNAAVASMPVRLQGPADVIGIDPRQVVRTEPPAGTIDYESNDLVAIDFDNSDLPWLFTPAAADAQGRLRPWLALVVVRKQEGVRLRPPRDEPLPVLEIAPPAVPANELPDLADSWAWVHAQLGAHEGASEAELHTVLATRPELSVSRLLSPRLLATFTDYIACVVPAFEAGRRAGLAEAVDANAPLTPAWGSGSEAPTRITLPIYFQWEFRTGAREDFESMVARLKPRDLREAVGRRPMEIGRPGFAVPPTTINASVLLEGALQPVNAPRAVWPDAATKAWQQALQSIVNAAGARATTADVEPVLGPPIYGRWYALRHEVSTGATPTWLDELNLDPRERVVAALGTSVIQQQQEELMAEAWQQAGEIARANQRLRQMQLSLAITTRLHARHVARIKDDDALWRFAAPAQARLVMPSATPGAGLVTMGLMLKSSSTPQAVTSAAMRRLTRPRGAISRRALTAVRIADVQPRAAIGKVAVTNFFHVFGAEPQIVFTPQARGLVSFDAVTRRLPAQHAGIVYARATDAAVAATPPRLEFEVNAEPIVLIGIVHGGFLDGGTLRAERPRPPLDGDVFEPAEPDVPPRPPRPPRPPPPPRVDSADAKAFREAAQRHLARVNPQVPLVAVVAWPVIRPLRERPALNPVSVQPQVHALLDPAPALQLRMAATILIAGSEAPRAIGAVGCSPTFPKPMSESLAALSQDWLLPGLERVPPDSVALLEPNARFIEAFMLGLNVEMGRELLWRDFPVGDPRATYFRRFWRAVNPRSDGDVAPIAEWADRKLGNNTAAQAGAKQVVLLVRSGLFHRYPNAVVYAVPAVRDGSARKPGAQAEERHPLFRGSLQPDVSFFGFELDADEATGDPGWYFVIQQQPTEPRFGFDVEIDFGGATHVSLAAPPAGHALPPGTQWARNGAHMARITRQQPVRVAIHASELLPPRD